MSGLASPPTGAPANPPPDHVVLLADDGTPIGTAPRTTVHGPDTPLHLAFSAYLFDPDGRLLLTRRALGKRTWPGVWTNSCCGHPRPGESPAAAATRRIREELGAEVTDVSLMLPSFRYRARDSGGTVENEVCPVFVARVPVALDPDPAEVADLTWVSWLDLVVAASAAPALLSPWAGQQIPQLAGMPGLADYLGGPS